MQRSTAVKCAHPDDKDFPPRSRDCYGLIDLRPHADEGGGDYQCPNCDRIVYPESYRKKKFDRLLVQHRLDGVESYLIEACGELAAGRSFKNGVLTMPIDGMNGAVCIVDYCTDERWNRRSTAVNQPCVYVTVGPDKFAQVLQEEAISRVELVDIVLGKMDIGALLISRVEGSPRLTNIDLSVSTLGVHPILPEVQGTTATPRTFNLHFSPAGLHINGLLAIRNDQEASIQILRVLVQEYVSSLMSGGPVKSLVDAKLAEHLNITDARSAARQVAPIRNSITKTVRREIGLPIDEHDVIETVSRSGVDTSDGQKGYRLNPRSVALGPLPKDSSV